MAAVRMTNKLGSTTSPWRFAEPGAIDWWMKARFGMFIHWGPAALGGGDISWCREGKPRLGDHQFVHQPGIPVEVYDRFYRSFDAARFDASEWVRVAQAAGMGYIVLTTKHHDGFCLFDSRYTRHRVTAPDCPCQRDIVAELADACHQAGMRFGLYYSARDWFHPDYLTRHHDRYLAFYHSQLLELLTKYGQVDILWFDHIGGLHERWDPDLVLKMARSLQPGILVNDRLHASVEHGRLPDFIGDFDTPEQTIGAYRTDRPWESCLCLVGGVWSYKPGGRMMTARECVASLVRCAGGDGNLLLNTGPLPDGRIEPRQAARLAEVGKWLAAHGESIYATRGGPLQPGAWGVSTHRGSTVYLHILDWAGRETLELPDLPGRIVSAQTLGGQPAVVTQAAGKMMVRVARADRGSLDTVVALETSDPAGEAR